MKKITIYLISITLILSWFGQYFTNETSVSAATKKNLPEVSGIVAQSAILIDPSNGSILYQKNCHKKMYPASITKIMTALLTIENCNMDDTVVYSKKNISSLTSEDANIGCQAGEKMTVKDCLYALMLASANEAATALAEHIAGDTDKFADMMNQRAKEAGATDTHFANPNGLHSTDHYVTAYDMAMIMKAAIQYPAFVNIIHSIQYTIPTNNKRTTPYLSVQRHKMLFSTSEYYDSDVIGGKTGYTDQAGKTLVTYAKRGDVSLICVVLKSSDDSTVFSDTRKLLDYGFDNFESINISEADSRFSSESDISLISPFSDTSAALVVDKDATILIPNNVSFSQIESEINFNTTDSSFATISYKYGDLVLGTAEIQYKKLSGYTQEDTNDLEETSTGQISTTKASVNNVSDKTVSDQSKKTVSEKNNTTAIVTIIFIIIIVIVVVIIFLAVKSHQKKLNKIRAMKRQRNR